MSQRASSLPPQQPQNQNLNQSLSQNQNQYQQQHQFQQSQSQSQPQNDSRELEQRIERLTRSETTLKLAVESLRSEIQEVIQERDDLRVQLEKAQEELNKKDIRSKIAQNLLLKPNEEVQRATPEKRSVQTSPLNSKNEIAEKVKENEKLQEEVKSLKNQKGQNEEKLEKEKEEMLKTLREREVMINEMTAENNKLYEEANKVKKSLNEANQKFTVVSADYEALKGQLETVRRDLEKERKKTTKLETEIKEKEVVKESDLRSEKYKERSKTEQALQDKIRERDALLEELERLRRDTSLEKKIREERRKKTYESEQEANVEFEKASQENKALKRKVQILADRVSDLKELESRNDQLIHDFKIIESELVRVCEIWDCSKDLVQRSKTDDGKSIERVSKRILRFIQDLNDKFERLKTTEKGSLEAFNEGERKYAHEITKWKEEAAKAKEKVKVLRKEITILTETQEEIYARLSKKEAEADMLKESISKKHELDHDQMRAEISRLREELKQRDDEISKLRVFIFNEEVRDLIRETVQIGHEIRKEEKEAKRSRSREREEVKGKDSLESLKTKKKILVEDLYLLQVQEQRKHESVKKLEKQNFQLQNEVSRLMNELEVNFSKFGESTSEYYNYKRNERHSSSQSKEKRNESSEPRTRDLSSSAEKNKQLHLNLKKIPPFDPKAKKVEEDPKNSSFTKEKSLDISINKPKRKKPSVGEN